MNSRYAVEEGLAVWAGMTDSRLEVPNIQSVKDASVRHRKRHVDNGNILKFFRMECSTPSVHVLRGCKHGLSPNRVVRSCRPPK